MARREPIPGGSSSASMPHTAMFNTSDYRLCEFAVDFNQVRISPQA